MSSLAERLKERKRVQWAIAYAGAALCLLEVLGIVARNFGWSALITRSAIVLGGIGFFITFSRVGPGVEEQATVAPSPSTGKPSVAVLPFDNRRQRPEDADLTDGIHDQILTQLSKLASLRVVSRTSVMEYRDTPENSRVIGQELGAEYLLEGGSQRAGERVLVTARLIDAETHTHLWSADRERAYSVAELFDIQRFPIDRYDGSSKASSAKGSWSQVRVYRG